jgi:hypothetical protein
LKEGEFNIEEKSPMTVEKMGFGCCVDNYGEKIYAVGGSLDNRKATNTCEVYNIAAN